MICPKCKSPNIIFCGLKAKSNGEWENSWECINKIDGVDCNAKWTTEIENIGIDERRT